MHETRIRTFFMMDTNQGERKLEYIHQNPVTAGIVEKAEEYVYSSARDYHYGKKVGLLEVEWL